MPRKAVHHSSFSPLFLVSRQTKTGYTRRGGRATREAFVAHLALPPRATHHTQEGSPLCADTFFVHFCWVWASCCRAARRHNGRSPTSWPISKRPPRTRQ